MPLNNLVGSSMFWLPWWWVNFQFHYKIFEFVFLRLIKTLMGLECVTLSSEQGNEETRISSKEFLLMKNFREQGAQERQTLNDD